MSCLQASPEFGAIAPEGRTHARAQHAGSTRGERSDGKIICSPLDGPSRYERRRDNRRSHSLQIVLSRTQHLGTFDGERKQLASVAFDRCETLGRDLASLAWLCAFLLIVAFVVGAL